MDPKQEGCRAPVTGSTAGIGFAVARKLAADGAAVVVKGRSRDRVERTLARIAEAVPGAGIDGVAADAGSAQGAAVRVDGGAVNPIVP